MSVPEPDQIRAALSQEGGAGVLTTLIYADPLSWVEPLAAIAQSASGVTRTEAFIALAIALMTAVVRSPDRLPLDRILPALRAGLAHESPSLPVLASAEALGIQAWPLAADLRPLLRYPDPSARYMAARALLALGTRAAETHNGRLSGPAWVRKRTAKRTAPAAQR